MPQEQKNELIKQYITQLAIELNTQYPNLFDEAKIKKAYEKSRNKKTNNYIGLSNY